jgi:hypothetical protein
MPISLNMTRVRANVKKLTMPSMASALRMARFASAERTSAVSDAV